MPKKTLNQNDADNPLTVLFRILATALLDDQHGVNFTAKNALLILADVIKNGMGQELEKKITRENGRYKYDQ
jgi:hypothetical protein